MWLKKVVFLLLLQTQWLLVVAGDANSEHHGVLTLWDFARLAERVDKLEKKNIQLEEKIEHLERENADQKQKIGSIEERLKDIESERIVKMVEIKNIQKENKVLRQMISQLDATIEMVVNEVVDGLQLHSYERVSGKDMEKSGTRGENRLTGRPHHRQNRTKIQMVKPITTLLKNEKRRKRMIVDEHQKVVFTAFVTQTVYGPLGPNQILKFDNVLTNLGNGYHPHSGTFIAPVDGVYMIHITVAGNYHKYDENYVTLRKNGQILCKFLVSHGSQSSQMMFLNLKTNDEVNAANEVDHDYLLGDFYTTFSGILLYPTE